VATSDVKDHIKEYIPRERLAKAEMKFPAEPYKWKLASSPVKAA